MVRDTPRLGAALAICAVMSTGCDEVPPKEGIRESEVVRLLGAPDFVITDLSAMDFYLPLARDDRDGCVRDAAKVLFYERWLTEDLTTAIDRGGHVRCTSRAHYMTSH